MPNTYSPLPWYVGPHPGNGAGTKWRTLLTDGGEFKPAFVGEAIEEDADLIVRAINAHAALVAALEWAVNFIDTYAKEQSGPCTPEFNKARAALALAKE